MHSNDKHVTACGKTSQLQFKDVRHVFYVWEIKVGVREPLNVSLARKKSSKIHRMNEKGTKMNTDEQYLHGSFAINLC